jgi:hypothetical protein
MGIKERISAAFVEETKREFLGYLFPRLQKTEGGEKMIPNLWLFKRHLLGVLNFILLDYNHIQLLLREIMTLSDLIERLKMHATQTDEAYLFPTVIIMSKYNMRNRISMSKNVAI